MSFSSTDVPCDVTALRARGVVFEEYDFPGLKTVQGWRGSATSRPRGFKDLEGDILGISTGISRGTKVIAFITTAQSVRIAEMLHPTLKSSSFLAVEQKRILVAG
jgi:hypothetical protein